MVRLCIFITEDLLNPETRDKINQENFEMIDLDGDNNKQLESEAHSCWTASIARMKNFIGSEKNFSQAG